MTTSRQRREAIAILQARSDIHIVFTDIQMQGSMNGLKLARFVRDPKPYTAARIAEVLGSLAAPA